ncbi:hypothetical protein [Bacillus sp. 03113]
MTDEGVLQLEDDTGTIHYVYFTDI